jgi:hypothetical protein
MILGHSSSRVTFDRYGRLFEGHADELMNAHDDTTAPVLLTARPVPLETAPIAGVAGVDAQTEWHAESGRRSSGLQNT